MRVDLHFLKGTSSPLQSIGSKLLTFPLFLVFYHLSRIRDDSQAAAMLSTELSALVPLAPLQQPHREEEAATSP